MRRVARAWLITVSVLNGVAGLVCGPLLIAKPDGRFLVATALLPVVRTLPLANIFFVDLSWIGVAMICVLGIPNAVAAVMLVRKSRGQYQFALAAALLLMCWCGFELIYMFNVAAVGYTAVGIASATFALLLLAKAHKGGA